jgi:glycosyltransferase involved in cell wall biosynthesis
MKIAIVHDELMRRGGAEQVVYCFHMAFPNAPIYVMAYDETHTYPEFKNCIVKTSWLQKFVTSEKRMKSLFFPFGIIAMKQLDVSKYDVILISSTYCAKYVRIPPKALVINYCYTPFRLAWNPRSYGEYNSAKGLKKLLYEIVIRILKKIDFRAAQRTDFFVAMTDETKDRIRAAYGHKKEIEIINPPVDCSKFYISDEPKEYYLLVSRLEYYKRVDLVVDAFNQLGYPLIIVGRGSREATLKKSANANVNFRSGLSASEIAKLYSNCKAFIFPQHEDYGITPLEANASGRPVIAFGKGGVLATMIPYIQDATKSTAIFFSKQNTDSLIGAIKKFEKLQFDPVFIRQHAMKFDTPLFVNKIKTFVEEKHGQFQRQSV